MKELITTIDNLNYKLTTIDNLNGIKTHSHDLTYIELQQNINTLIQVNSMNRIIVFKDDTMNRCWRTKSKYKSFGNKIPYGLVHRMCDFDYAGLVRHLCGDGRCINPMHLKSGTHQENGRDSGEKIRWVRNQEKILLFSIGGHREILKLIADAMYADYVAERLKVLSKYEYMSDKHRDMAIWVWDNLVKDNLVIVNNYIELIGELNNE